MDRSRLIKGIEDSARAIQSLGGQAAELEAVCEALIRALKAGNKVLTAGNGGSASEAMHMTEELIGRFRGNRRPLPAVCLAADGTALTCIANDFGYDEVFSRQVEGLGKAGDVLVLFSTSGRSANLVKALDAASRAGVKTICLLGKGGGDMKGRADYEIIVQSQATEHIQEAHQVMMHLMLDAVELAFGPV